MDDLFPDIGNTEFGDFEITEFKQSKVLDTNFNTYIKRCEIELQKGNYNNAKIEIDKAINFAETYEEKVHCTKEKIRVLKGKDYFDFVEYNLEKFLNDYGIDFLLERAYLNYREDLIEKLSVNIIKKSIDLDVYEFYSCSKYIKDDVNIIKIYLSNNVEKVYSGIYKYEEDGKNLVLRIYNSETISKEEFKSLIVKINNSRVISKIEKENLLIKYIVYAIKNNREYDFLISLYMNINDLPKEKIELLEKNLKKESIFKGDIKNKILELKLEYLKSNDLFEFVKENIDILSQKYGINYLVNKVARTCSLKEYKEIIFLVLNNKLNKITEFYFGEYIKILGEEESCIFIKENIEKLILQYSANKLLNIVKTNFSNDRKTKLIRLIFNTVISKESLTKNNIFTYKDIKDNIEYLDNNYIYHYLNINIKYISNIIMSTNQNLFIENNGLINDYYQKIENTQDLSREFNIINFSLLIYKLLEEKNIDKNTVEKLIFKYILINIDNKKLVYYLSIYFEIIGYYKLNNKEKIYRLNKTKQDIENNLKYRNNNLEEIIMLEKIKYLNKEEKIELLKEDIDFIFDKFGIKEIIKNIDENLKIENNLSIIDFVFKRELKIIAIDDFIKYNNKINDSSIIKEYLEINIKNISEYASSIHNNALKQCFYRINNDKNIDKLSLEKLILFEYIPYNVKKYNERKRNMEINKIEYFIDLYLDEILENVAYIEKIKKIEIVLEEAGYPKILEKKLIFKYVLKIEEGEYIKKYIEKNICYLYEIYGFRNFIEEINNINKIEYEYKKDIINCLYDCVSEKITLEEFNIIANDIRDKNKIVSFYKDNLASLKQKNLLIDILSDIINKEIIDEKGKCEIIEYIFDIEKSNISLNELEIVTKYVQNKYKIIVYLRENINKIIKSINKYSDVIIILNILLELENYISNEEIENILLEYIQRRTEFKTKSNYEYFVEMYLEKICPTKKKILKKEKLIKIFVERSYEEEYIKKFIRVKSESKEEEKVLYKIFIEENLKNNKFIRKNSINEIFDFGFDIQEGINLLKEFIYIEYRYKEIIYFKISELELKEIMNNPNIKGKRKKLKTIEKNLEKAEDLSIENNTKAYLTSIYNTLLKLYDFIGVRKNLKKKKLLKKIENNFKTKEKNMINRVLICILTVSIALSSLFIFIEKKNRNKLEASKINKENSIQNSEKIPNNPKVEEKEKNKESVSDEEKDLEENNPIVKKSLPTRYSEYGDYDFNTQEYFMEMENLLTQYYTDYEKAVANADYSYVSGDLVDDGQLSKELKISIPQYKHKSVYVKHFSIYNFEVYGNQASFNLDTVFIVDNEIIQIETQRMTTYYDYYSQGWLIDNYTDWDIIYKQNYNPDTDYFDFTNYRDYF